MKTQNAINKLINAGWNVKKEAGTLYAEKDNHHFITINTVGENTNGKFIYESKTSCAPTAFTSLKRAMDVYCGAEKNVEKGTYTEVPSQPIMVIGG